MRWWRVFHFLCAFAVGKPNEGPNRVLAGSMNRQAKSAIKSLVLTLRHKLEDDVALQAR